MARYVRTEEGARFYGAPVGTLITEDQISSRARIGQGKGVSLPKDGLSQKVTSKKFTLRVRRVIGKGKVRMFTYMANSEAEASALAAALKASGATVSITEGAARA